MKRYLGLVFAILIAMPCSVLAVDTETFDEEFPYTYLQFSYDCEEGSLLMGDFEVSSFLNVGSVDFWILDAGNYTLWYRQGHYGEDLHLSVYALYNMTEVKGSASWRFSVTTDGMYYLLFQPSAVFSLKGTIEYRTPTEASAFLTGELVGNIIVSVFVFGTVLLLLGYVIRGHFKPKKYTKPPPQGYTQQYTPSNAKAFCSYCGSPRHRLDASYCSRCGAYLGEGASLQN